MGSSQSGDQRQTPVYHNPEAAAVNAGMTEPREQELYWEREMKQLHVEKLALAPDTHDGLVASAVLYFWTPEDNDFKVPQHIVSYRKQSGSCTALMTLLVAVILHWGCCFLQFTLVFLLFATTVEKMEDPFEVGLDEKIQALRNYTNNNIPISQHGSHGPILTLCQQDETLHYTVISHTFVLALWGFRMLKELMGVGFRCLVVLSIMSPHESHADAIKVKVDTNNPRDCERHIIFEMSCGVKVLLFFLVTLPHFLNSVFLLWMGAKMLMLATTMGTLIMKSISLQFIVTIDELLFAAVPSRALRKRVQEMSYRYDSSANITGWMDAFGIPLLKMAIVALFVFLIHNVIFGKIYEYRLACEDYFNKFGRGFTHARQGLQILKTMGWSAIR